MCGNFAIKGGGIGPLMANAILNFHFDFLNPSLITIPVHFFLPHMVVLEGLWQASTAAVAARPSWWRRSDKDNRALATDATVHRAQNKTTIAIIIYVGLCPIPFEIALIVTIRAYNIV